MAELWVVERVELKVYPMVVLRVASLVVQMVD
jgi:hypothetical protein